MHGLDADGAGTAARAAKGGVAPAHTERSSWARLHLLLLTALLALLAHRYTRPIVRMAAQIQSSDNPLDLSLADSMRRSDETGVLARSIDDMIGRVKRLNAEQQVILKQQRLLEIDVLQGQIHPAFFGQHPRLHTKSRQGRPLRRRAGKR